MEKKSEAGLFISLHCNASENSKIKAVTAVANEELVIVREAAKYLEK